MSHLILIKHAMPEIDMSKSSRDWVLSAEGRQACVPLAEKLHVYAPEQMITSDEPKARDTGQLVAEHLGIPWSTVANLHEHDRRGVAFVPDKAHWRATIKTFFDQPDDLILGRETANQACMRFAQAMDQVLEAHPGTLAIATHGTVIALFVAQRAGVDGFDLWQRLGLPSFVVLDRANFGVIDVVGQVGAV